MGFLDKIDNVSGSIIRKVLEKVVKCLLRVIVNAGHSIRMCLTVATAINASVR